MPINPELLSILHSANLSRAPSPDDAKNAIKHRCLSIAMATGAPSQAVAWLTSPGSSILDADVITAIDDYVDRLWRPPSRGATRRALEPPIPSTDQHSEKNKPRIQIRIPEPGTIIPLKYDPTSRGTGAEKALYHDRITFLAEVTDGEQPFTYHWQIKPESGGFRDFWPNDPGFNEGITDEHDPDGRHHGFHKGGQDEPPFNFQIVRRISQHSDPIYRHASIPPGKYIVRVTVEGRNGSAKAEIEIFVTDSAVLWARIEEPESRKSWYVKKIASTGQFCHEKIKFRAAAGGGKGHYTFEWTLTHLTAVPTPAGPGHGAFTPLPVPMHRPFGALPSPTRTITRIVEPSTEPGTHDKFNLVHDEFVLGGEDHPILRSATPGDTGDDNASLDAGEWRIELKVTDSEGNSCEEPKLTNIFINREPESTVMDYREGLEKGEDVKAIREREAERTLREEREKLRSGSNYREQEHPMFYQSRWRGMQEGQEQIEGVQGWKQIKRGASVVRGAASRNLGPGKGAWLRGTAERQGGFGPMMDPYLRGAIAWGRKQLGIIAQQEYERIWKETRPDLIAATTSYKEEKKNYRQLHEKADEIYKHLSTHSDASATKAITSVIGGAATGGAAGAATGAAGALVGMLGNDAGATGEGAVRIITEKLQEMDRRLREKENQFRKILASRDVYDSMTKYLKENVERIAQEACWKYKIDKKSEIMGELDGEVVKLAEIWQLQSRTALRGFLARTGYLIRNVSYASRTLGDIWFALLSNLWEFLMGPWIVGAIIVILQSLLLAYYAHASFAYLWMMPIIGAIIVFILNFSESKYPMEWVQHLVTGVVIGYSALILLLALHVDEVTGVFWFWIIWFILVIFIGAFQIYATGGWKAVLSVAMVILLFGYIALGPYHGYYDYVKGEVKKPLEIGWRALKDAFENVWLLATNPTEWYARQQTINVRPEKPIDWPHALEITRIDALPPSVPASNPFRNCEPPSTFAMVTIIQNQGDMDATNIVESIGCNEWCKVDQQTATKDKDILRPGEGQIVQFQNLAAYCPEKDHAAEFEMAKVFINFTYTYRTNSTLQTQVMSRTEIERLFAEGKDVYENVPAVSKVGPAQLSLNVGPQPLTAGLNKTILLVSVSNTRSDGYIILEPGMNVIITLPKSIGSGLNCAAGKKPLDDDPEKEVWTFPITERLEVRPFEFKSIFAFICQFDVRADVQEVRTGLIRAELPEYKYKVTKDKDIPITLPLGIFAGSLPGDENKCHAQVENKFSEFQKHETNIQQLSNKKQAIGTEQKSFLEVLGGDANKVKAVIGANMFPIYTPSGGGQSVVGPTVSLTQVEKYIARYEGSGFAGHAQDFITLGQQYNIDPAFALAVSAKESTVGTARCWGLPRECNPYFCITAMEGYPSRDVTVTRGGRQVTVHVACFTGGPQQAIEAFYKLIKNNYVNDGQDTIPEINCQPGTDFASSSHCYEESKNPGWVSEVEQFRKDVQSMSDPSKGSDPTAPAYTATGIRERYVRWKYGPQGVETDQMEGTKLLHITSEEFGDAGCSAAVNVAYSENDMTPAQEIECAMLILMKNSTKLDEIQKSYSYQEWLKCIFTAGAFGPAGVPVIPVKGATLSSVTACFRKDGWWQCQGKHTGFDITAKEGTPVYAIFPGRVVIADDSGDCGSYTGGSAHVSGGSAYGKCVAIEHTSKTGKKFYTFYAHLSSVDPLVKIPPTSVSPTTVHAGQQIGTVGHTGYSGDTPSHLHLELRKFPGRWCGGSGGGSPEEDAIDPCLLWENNPEFNCRSKCDLERAADKTEAQSIGI